MNNNYSVDFDLNKFLRDVRLKKQYLIKLRNKIDFLTKIKESNYKTLSSSITNIKQSYKKDDFLVSYIIDISFSQTNTLLHVMDSSGKLKFFCSAGTFSYKGKNKKARSLVFKNFYRVLATKLQFLKEKPVALHLKNVGSNKFWILKKLKKKILVKTVKSFNLYPHNGCRKKKFRRKKFKKRRNG